MCDKVLWNTYDVCEVRNLRYVSIDCVSKDDACKDQNKKQLHSNDKEFVNVHGKTQERHATYEKL